MDLWLVSCGDYYILGGWIMYDKEYIEHLENTLAQTRNAIVLGILFLTGLLIYQVW